MTELCSRYVADPHAARARWLAWLAGGARDVAWALCSIPSERWTATPPAADRLGEWPPARHVRHLALAEQRWFVPVVEAVVEERPLGARSSSELDEVDAAWDPSLSPEAVGDLVDVLGEGRFAVLQRLESAPDAAWHRPLPSGVAPGPRAARLDWLLARAHQHELEHLSTLWALALYWDRSSASTGPGVSLPLQRADRLEESR